MLENQAAYYRLGLQLGTHMVADVVRWADSEIARSAEPPVDLIDIALMAKSNPMDVASKLGNLSGPIKPLEVVDSVLGAAHTLLKTDPSFGPTLAQGLYRLYVEYCDEIPERLYPMAGFDDEYSLAKQGIYGTLEEAYQNLLAFTEKFPGAP